MYSFVVNPRLTDTLPTRAPPCSRVPPGAGEGLGSPAPLHARSALSAAATGAFALRSVVGRGREERGIVSLVCRCSGCGDYSHCATSLQVWAYGQRPWFTRHALASGPRGAQQQEAL